VLAEGSAETRTDQMRACLSPDGASSPAVVRGFDALERQTAGNAVTAAPVTINIVQGRLSLPVERDTHRLRFEIEGRLQDGQPRPERGFLATIEFALKASL